MITSLRGIPPWVLCYAAFVFTAWGLVADTVTLVSQSYAGVICQAILCSFLALVMIGEAWSRMPRPARVLSAGMVVADWWILLDALGRGLALLRR